MTPRRVPGGPVTRAVPVLSPPSSRRGRTPGTASAAEVTPAAGGPVARVLVDVAVAHLDRLHDYAVPPALDEAAAPGVRVRVRLAGRQRQAAGQRARRS